MSKRIMKKYDSKKLEWLRFGKQATVVAVIVVLILNFVIGISIVDGNSMEPTLSDGNIIMYLRLDKNYERGDIVAIKMPSGQFYVKRIIAVGGDTIDIRGNDVYRNDKKLNEPYIIGNNHIKKDSVMYPYHVEEGSVFVMGDNRSESMDSRVLGAIACDQVKGTALFVK